MLLLVILSTITIILGFVGFGMLVSIFFDAPFVPLPKSIVKAALDAAAIKKEERMIDLGSGDGRAVIEAARRGARASGVDISPALNVMAAFFARVKGVKAQFRTANFFDTDLREADVIYCYLFPETPNARIVTVSFSIAPWTPILKTKSGRFYIYLYDRSSIPQKTA